MTGGVVVVLGAVGRNFGAGMSNGVAYVLDEDGSFESRCNRDLVAVGALEEADERVVRSLVQEHLDQTGSPRAAAVLESWSLFRSRFKKVTPLLLHATPATESAEAEPQAVAR